MLLLGMVNFSEDIMEYETTGEQEFTEHMQRRAVGKNMKVVRQAMKQTVTSCLDGIQPKVSMAVVKPMTLLALQPVAKAMRPEEIQ